MGGPANIPFSEFASYASFFRFTLTEAEEVWEDVRVIDDCWLAAVAERTANSKGGRS